PPQQPRPVAERHEPPRGGRVTDPTSRGDRGAGPRQGSSRRRHPPQQPRRVVERNEPPRGGGTAGAPCPGNRPRLRAPSRTPPSAPEEGNRQPYVVAEKDGHVRRSDQTAAGGNAARRRLDR